MMFSYKVIFHIDEMSKWKLLLGNVRNLLNGFKDDSVDVIVLANAEAVQFYVYKEEMNPLIDLMKRLFSDGVNFVACNNSLNAHIIHKESLFEHVNIVPSGVVELVKRQSIGYAYIKP